MAEENRTFDENSEKGKKIMRMLGVWLQYTSFDMKITFTEPIPDLTRRVLNHIVEFRPAEEPKNEIDKDMPVLVI